jgi:hypothetical protein
MYDSITCKFIYTDSCKCSSKNPFSAIHRMKRSVRYADLRESKNTTGASLLRRMTCELPSLQETPLCFSAVRFGSGIKNGVFPALEASSTHDHYKIQKVTNSAENFLLFVSASFLLAVKSVSTYKKLMLIEVEGLRKRLFCSREHFNPSKVEHLCDCEEHCASCHSGSLCCHRADNCTVLLTMAHLALILKKMFLNRPRLLNAPCCRQQLLA